MSKTLYPLSKTSDLKKAYAAFTKAMRSASDLRLSKRVGWPGGYGDFNNVYSCAKHGFWFLFDSSLSSSSERHWCAFGAGSTDLPSLSVTVEINPPTRGLYRRSAGLFLEDKQGRVFLAHSGKIGGGKKGVGKTAFTKEYKGRRIQVDWPDGLETEALLISALDDKSLAGNIGAFVHAVRAFKDMHGKKSEPTKSELATASFSPEFSGSYVATVQHSKQVEKLHGRIVNELSSRLLDMGYRVSNDQKRDLMVAGRGKTVKVLFEAKTGARLTDIYTGVGQLLIHSSVKPQPRKLILVLPKTPNLATRNALKLLKIEVLLYSVSGNSIKFRNLDIIEG